MNGIGAPGGSTPRDPAPPTGAEREASVRTFRESAPPPRNPSTITALARLHVDVVTLSGGDAPAVAPDGLRPADAGRPAAAPDGAPRRGDPGYHSPAAVRARLIQLFLSMAVDDESRRPWHPLTGTDPELPPEDLPADPLTLAERVAGDVERRALAERVAREGFAGVRALDRAAGATGEAGATERLVPGVATPGAAPAPPLHVFTPAGAAVMLALSTLHGAPLHPRAATWRRDPAQPLRWRDLLSAAPWTTMGDEVRRRLVRWLVGAALLGGAGWWLAFGSGG